MSRTLPIQNVPLVAWGTAGRDIDTPLSFFQIGDGSGTDTGITTVHVQLFDGRDPTATLDASSGQGRYVLCQLSPAIFVLPQYGDRVLVVTPNSYGTLPGNSTIVAVVDPRGEIIFGDLQPGEMVLAPRAGGGRIVGRKDGTFEVGIPLPTFTAALSQLVDSVITTIVGDFNSHTHTAPGGSGGPTTPPLTPISAQPSTASQILKISS